MVVGEGQKEGIGPGGVLWLCFALELHNGPSYMQSIWVINIGVRKNPPVLSYHDFLMLSFLISTHL